MDEIDKKIIEILKEDSSQPYTQISKQVGLSEGAVRKRVQNLVKTGAIRKFTITLGIKEGVKAITLASAASTPEVSNEILKLEGVETIYEITGSYDIAAILTAPNIDEINKCVDKIRNIPGISNTNTMVVLRSYS